MSDALTPRHMREVLATATTTYARLLAGGLVLAVGDAPQPTVDVGLVAHGDARTLYRDRRPVCRSLDGVCSIQDRRRQCAGCDDRALCTAQIRVDFTCDARAYRLLLARTSARNYLLYERLLARRSLRLDHVRTRLTVVDRGAWGELRFALLPDGPRTTPRN